MGRNNNYDISDIYRKNLTSRHRVAPVDSLSLSSICKTIVYRSFESYYFAFFDRIQAFDNKFLYGH